MYARCQLKFRTIHLIQPYFSYWLPTPLVPQIANTCDKMVLDSCGIYLCPLLTPWKAFFCHRAPPSLSSSAFQDALSELDQRAKGPAQVSGFTVTGNAFLCDASSISYQLLLLHNKPLQDPVV